MSDTKRSGNSWNGSQQAMASTSAIRILGAAVFLCEVDAVEGRGACHYSSLNKKAPQSRGAETLRGSQGAAPAMRYKQVDAIVVLEPGQRIVARRTLHADEQYLLDHFPRFPVMPGVMMLEALFQAGMWLVRASDPERHPIVVLREVRGAKFADFLAPGQTLEIVAELQKLGSQRATVRASADKGDGKPCVSGRFELELRHFDPKDRALPPAAYTEGKMQQVLEELLAAGRAVVASASAG